MPVLTPPQRKSLEDACTKGRRAAEQAVRAALTSLAISVERPPAHLNEDDRILRRGLRAKARQLGERGENLELLIAECAFEQWHRLLFARFLAENNLLIHPEFRAPVTIDDCEELAVSLGEPDGWSVAARFAAEILPGIFRVDDPCVCLSLAPEGRLALETILAGLPSAIFEGDDALGWVYQYWQKDRKDEVNLSERKVGGADIGPVTQLFTENYMVRYLLQNSLGAWWASRHPGSPLVDSFEFLRVDESGTPAAGKFEGWPDRVAEVTMMDPCCGSGHFLVEAFSMLSLMRAEEEEVPAVEAQDAVLRDNIFGLELDPRCVQIAMFAVAIQAWKVAGGWRELPVPNVACSGIPVKAPVDEWKALAHGDQRTESALVRLHILFRDADTLGSLIDPRLETEVSDPTGLQASFDDVDWEEVAPLLRLALTNEEGDPTAAVLGADAAGVARAADFLSRSYTLVSTNVPYLGSSGQSERLREVLGRRWPTAAGDIATAFLLRWLDRSSSGHSVALVLPQAWLYQASYERMRRDLLTSTTWNLLARLGSRAFGAITGEVVNVCLLHLTAGIASRMHLLSGVDVSRFTTPTEKARGLKEDPLVQTSQTDQLSHPESRVSLVTLAPDSLLSRYAFSTQGLKTGDNARFVRMFWELPTLDPIWERYQGPVETSDMWGGRQEVIRWESGRGAVVTSEQARIQGQNAWGRQGVLVREVGDLPVSIYGGHMFQSSGVAVVPHDSALLPALWAFLSSDEYRTQVRHLDPKLGIATASAVAVPFDVERWRHCAQEDFPEGLPSPSANDPVQWHFAGRPEVASSPLHTAVARLLGYRWPGQPALDGLEGLVDSDGIVCIPSVAGEEPAADRGPQPSSSC
jgi:hypothetical protein